MTEPTQPQPNPATPPPAKKSNALMYFLVGCGMFVLICGLAATIFFWWGVHKAKSYVKHAVEAETGSMKQATTLWSDVPRMEGMNEAQQIEMPAIVKVVARPMLDTMMRGVNDGKSAGSWDFTAFSLKGKTTADVQTFYDAKRMSANGWEQNGGCQTMGAGNAPLTMCAFKKQVAGKTTGILIISTNDDTQKAASLFILRNEGAPSSQ